MTSTVEKTPSGTVITGFEYTYDDLSRVVEEKVLANSTKMCYTYDNLSRVTARTVKKLSDNSIVSTETFNYDAAGNVTSAPDSSFQYDTNNRLISFNRNTVSYDLDGNMLNNGAKSFTYDSANKLITAGGHTYTYNAEDVRIRNLCADEDTTYTYDTNCKLSKLLMKTTNGVVTKYVYGRGLIGEEVNNTFKTYHFDCRGSTIAITDASGNISDTFAYDTYGKLISKTGTNEVIFGYNGRDGVVTDKNGLIYMRARYYSPEMHRFINADIIPGKLANAVTLNRYAYANANPAMYVDPTGLFIGSAVAAGVGLLVGLVLGLTGCSKKETSAPSSLPYNINIEDEPDTPKITSRKEAEVLYKSGQITLDEIPPEYSWEPSVRAQYEEEKKKQKIANNPPKTESDLEKAAILAIEKAVDEVKDQAIDWGASKMDELAGFGDLIVPDRTPPSVYIGRTSKVISITQTVYDIFSGAVDNYNAGESWGEIGTDAALDVGSVLVPIGVQAGTTWAVTKIGAAVGTAVAPGVGTAIGTVFGLLAGVAYNIWGKPALDDLFE